MSSIVRLSNRKEQCKVFTVTIKFCCILDISKNVFWHQLKSLQLFVFAKFLNWKYLDEPVNRWIGRWYMQMISICLNKHNLYTMYVLLIVGNCKFIDCILGRQLIFHCFWRIIQVDLILLVHHTLFWGPECILV